MKDILPLGKLDYRFLERLLKKYRGKNDPRLIIGPRLGEDAAVIDYPDRYLVVKTDPVTYATDMIGWYVVNINANDIATRGAIPMWFQATILLPDKKTTKNLVDEIFSQVSSACQHLNIALTGGHTEVSYSLDRPIIAGCMLGEVPKNKLVSTSGAKPGDLIILTKGIVVEGTSIIAREKDGELKVKGYSSGFIRKCKDFLYSPGLSVVKDALLANKFKVHSMHDPTEGGLAGGLYEIASASKVGIMIEKEKIPIFKESKILCREYGLDPLGTIASGALLIIASRKESIKIISILERNAIGASIIGEIKDKDFGIKIKHCGKIENLKFSAKDEITRIFKYI
jgi:hydrogenase maturation factor